MTYPVHQLFPRGSGLADVKVYRVGDWPLRVKDILGKFKTWRGPKWRLEVDTLVILSQPGHPYDGVSITNGFECAAAQVRKNYEIVIERTLWFEHYPYVPGEFEIVPGERPSFCKVDLTWHVRPSKPGSEALYFTPCHPYWYPIPRALMALVLGPSSMLSVNRK